MQSNFRTPLLAAFFFTAFLTGCSNDGETTPVAIVNCAITTTPIAVIQGSKPTSARVDEQLSIQGIVTLIQDGEGLYVEEPDSDNDDATSNAIFVETSALPTQFGPGSWISARGTVTEIPKGRQSLTALTQVSGLTLCASDQPLPLTTVELPLNGFAREAYEGMRIQLDGELTVNDVYRFASGGFSFTGNGFQFVATEVTAPGPGTMKHAQNNRNFSLSARLSEHASGPTLLNAGSPIDRISGVLAHDARELQLAVQSMSGNDSAQFEAPAEAGEDELRVVGMNLKNYFNGDGKGGKFPTPRGAKTLADFEQQRQRIGAAIQVLNPHVLAVMELENDGFGSLSAATDFISLAQEATGGSWQVIRPVDDDTGGDKIRVALFYRDDLLQAPGSASTLSGAEFRRSRQPLAQLFRHRDGGEAVLVAVNHFKSKGSCPDSGINSNQKDGQGCWNDMRVASAEKMSAWIKSLAVAAATDHILILGDMNAYRQEDPINAIRDAGFIELMDDSQDDNYSFIFFGQAGTLDYAFASETLQQKVQRAFIWNVSAAFPMNMDLPQPWLGFSDHDPVVVDIRLDHSSTSD